MVSTNNPYYALNNPFSLASVICHLLSTHVSNATLSTVFAGKDPSRALASSSLKADECVPEWYDLEEEKKTVLNDWFKFFSKRYDIVGKVEGANNYDRN